MVITVFGSALFLMPMGVSTFAVPKEGQAYLAGIEEFAKLPSTFADTVLVLTALLVITPVCGQRAPGHSGLALRNAAQVVRSHLGCCGRVHISLVYRVCGSDPGRPEYPTNGARWGVAGGDRGSLDSLERDAQSFKAGSRS